ncbi:MAG: hypothetical protein SH820_05090 [Xanthomonadales bacterium]|nr:hypothetical protein [Xanthomonadales bacterium]
MISLLLSVVACSSQTPAPAQSQQLNQDILAATALITNDWPAPSIELQTTAGDIYVANLDSQIQVLQHKFDTTRQTPVSVMLAGLFYHRFQLQGRIADAEASAELLKNEMDADRLGPAEMLVYVKILAGLHQFEQAENVIASAAKNGGKESDIVQAREAILSSRQLPTLNPGDTVPVDYIAAVQQAARLLNRGNLYAASEKLYLAQQLYRDSSPFPLAWIYLQQGVAFLRYQQYEQARVFFAAAHERLPQYYLATEHLAETEALLGNWQVSAELYREVTAQTGQAAFWHGLQQAEAQLGHDADAMLAAQQADEDYRALLQQHPLTFADHAVYYYLDTGREQRALELAELNYENRQDVTAHLALAEALVANGRQEQACEHVQALRQAGLSPPEIVLPGEKLSACER